MKSDQISILIDKQGNLTTLYQDNLFCLKIDGNMKATRASDVRFSNGFWEIFKQTPTGEVKIGHKHELRQDAIQEEIDILNEDLYNGSNPEI